MAAYQLDGSELPSSLPELPFAFARNFGVILTERQGTPVLLCRQGVTPQTLLEVRRVKPLLLLRGSELAARGSLLSRIDWLQVAAAVLVIIGLVAVASWQAASLRAGGLVSAGFAGVTLVLFAAAWGLVRLSVPLARSSSMARRISSSLPLSSPVTTQSVSSSK